MMLVATEEIPPSRFPVVQRSVRIRCRLQLYVAWTDREVGKLGDAGNYIATSDYIVTSLVRWNRLPESKNPEWRLIRRRGPFVYAKRFLLAVTLFD